MAFIDSIKKRAKQNKKTIVLPETADMRTLEAAHKILQEGIADIILVGDKQTIIKKADGLDLTGAKFVDPYDCDKLNDYVSILVELRKKKGMTPEEAKELLLTNPLYFGCMMVKQDDADGMVAGAMVKTGKVKRTDKARLIRDGIVIFTGSINALKRFKDDVKEVKAGYECGLVFEGFNDIAELDIVEAYTMVEVPR